MKIEIELTDEQIKWAKVLAKGASGKGTYSSLAHAIVNALPQPTLQEQAFKVIYPNYHPPRWESNPVAVTDMARWLYMNGRDRYWYVGRFEPSPNSYSRSRYMACHFQGSIEYFDSLVDAYAPCSCGSGRMNAPDVIPEWLDHAPHEELMRMVMRANEIIFDQWSGLSENPDILTLLQGNPHDELDRVFHKAEEIKGRCDEWPSCSVCVGCS